MSAKISFYGLIKHWHRRIRVLLQTDLQKGIAETLKTVLYLEFVETSMADQIE